MVVLVLCVSAGFYYWSNFYNGSENVLNENNSEIKSTNADEIFENSNETALNDEQKLLEKINRNKLVQGCLDGKDCIPSIDDPKFVSANSASSFIENDEMVIGLNIGGEFKAYPVKILNWHEIVNDKIGDKYVAVTFCPLCFTGVAYERVIEDQPVEFGVSGYLLNSNLVLYDRTTDSLYEQLTGEALTGPRIGEKLNKITAWTMPFGLWKRDHPDTLVLSVDTGFERDYDLYPYGEYKDSKEIYFALENADNRLFEKDLIAGVTIGDKSKAYPFSVLRENYSDGGQFEDTVGGHPVLIKWDNQKFEAVDTVKDQQVVPVTAYWFAWAAFNPGTEIYDK